MEMPGNYDNIIERMYHPENFNEQDQRFHCAICNDLCEPEDESLQEGVCKNCYVEESWE